MANTGYIPNTFLMGSIDLASVVTAGTLGAPFSTTVLPSVTIEQQLGQIVGGWSAGAITAAETGWGEFIFLAVPTSTAVTVGLLYRWNAATFRVIVVPTAVSSQALSGAPFGVAINTVASNATSVQYTWFQIGGRSTVLKNATGQTVQPDTPLFVSGTTAGRVRTTASVFRTLIGFRSANTATVASTTSTLAVWLNRPNVGPGI